MHREVGNGANGGTIVTSSRYEEIAHYKHELEVAQRENTLLKQRIRELERAVREGGVNQSQIGRGRTGAPPGEVEDGVGDGDKEQTVAE